MKSSARSGAERADWAFGSSGRFRGAAGAAVLFRLSPAQ